MLCRLTAALLLLAGLTSPARAGDVSAAELSGSWQIVQGQGQGTIMTFNPDGSRVVSDGKGTNSEDGWELFEGSISLGEDEQEIFLDAGRLTIGETVLIRWALDGAPGAGQVFEAPEAAGLWMPEPGQAVDPVGEMQIKGFRAEPGGITFWLWDEALPLDVAKDGTPEREGEVVFAARDWEVRGERFAFRAAHPDWGDVVLAGTRAGDALVADMLVSGHVIRGLRFVRRLVK